MGSWCTSSNPRSSPKKVNLSKNDGPVSRLCPRWLGDSPLAIREVLEDAGNSQALDPHLSTMGLETKPQQGHTIIQCISVFRYGVLARVALYWRALNQGFSFLCSYCQI